MTTAYTEQTLTSSVPTPAANHLKACSEVSKLSTLYYVQRSKDETSFTRGD